MSQQIIASQFPLFWYTAQLFIVCRAFSQTISAYRAHMFRSAKFSGGEDDDDGCNTSQVNGVVCACMRKNGV